MTFIPKPSHVSPIGWDNISREEINRSVAYAMNSFEREDAKVFVYPLVLDEQETRYYLEFMKSLSEVDKEEFISVPDWATGSAEFWRWLEEQ